MITGPILPRTRAGLWSLLAQHGDRVERGLVAIETDFQLQERLHVDALARDAMGRPVLLFAWLAGEDDDLPWRVLEALAWFERNVPLLRDALVLPGLRVDLPARALVLGFDLASHLVDKLARLREPRLEAYEFRGFTAGGVCHVGVVPVLGPAVTGDEHGFRAPVGITDPRDRTLCTLLLERMHKLEPSLQVLGDRYSRRLRLDGALLLELRARADGVEVALPQRDGPPRRLRIRDADSLDAACDAAMRRYLELLDAEVAADEAAGRDGAARDVAASVAASVVAGSVVAGSVHTNGVAADAIASRLESTLRRDVLGPNAVSNGVAPGPDRTGGDRVAADPLRRSTPETNLTKEELSALSGPPQ